MSRANTLPRLQGWLWMTPLPDELFRNRHAHARSGLKDRELEVAGRPRLQALARPATPALQQPSRSGSAVARFALLCHASGPDVCPEPHPERGCAMRAGLSN